MAFILFRNLAWQQIIQGLRSTFYLKIKNQTVFLASTLFSDVGLTLTGNLLCSQHVSVCLWLWRCSVLSRWPMNTQQLNPVYLIALHFMIVSLFFVSHGWLDLPIIQKNWLKLFIYKALLLKLPNYLTSLLTLKSSNYSTQASNYLTLDILHVRTNFERVGSDSVLKIQSYIIGLKS